MTSRSGKIAGSMSCMARHCRMSHSGNRSVHDTSAAARFEAFIVKRVVSGQSAVGSGQSVVGSAFCSIFIPGGGVNPSSKFTPKCGMPLLSDFRALMRHRTASTVFPHRRCSAGRRINQNRPVSKHRRHIPQSKYRSRDIAQLVNDFQVLASNSREVCSNAEWLSTDRFSTDIPSGS